MTTAEQPIGYWLKRLDALIDATFDRSLADHGLSRRHWQILEMLRGGSQDAERLADGLRPFWGEGAITLTEATGELERRGWLRRGDDSRWALTPAGEAGHAELARRVHANRRRLMDGITPAEYGAAVATMRRMAANLETSEDRPAPRAGPAPTPPDSEAGHRMSG